MPKDFFDYFPVANAHKLWGVYATSLGHGRILAGSPYPSAHHPSNHSLGWEKGRILQEYQIIYISAGSGEFESDLSPHSQVHEGSLLILFPGVRHRYRPVPDLGWTESWIELQGPHVEELQRLKIIHPKHPVHQVGEVPEIMAGFTVASQLAWAKPSGFQVKLGLIGLQILTHLAWPPPPPESPAQRIERVVQEAMSLLASDIAQPLSPESVARQLKVGYSNFRRTFKRQTGFSPKQYQLEIRLRRVCGFLRHSDLTIKEIAERLGYDSPYHLSTAFKKRMHASPNKWRHALAKSLLDSLQRGDCKMNRVE